MGAGKSNLLNKLVASYDMVYGFKRARKSFISKMSLKSVTMGTHRVQYEHVKKEREHFIDS